MRIDIYTCVCVLIVQTKFLLQLELGQLRMQEQTKTYYMGLNFINLKLLIDFFYKVTGPETLNRERKEKKKKTKNLTRLMMFKFF